MMRKEPASELWAVVDKETGNVMYGRGGSSSTARLMVYPSKGRAEAALSNPWTLQVIDPEKVVVRCVY